jgi:L-fucose isomerase-like protein
MRTCQPAKGDDNMPSANTSFAVIFGGNALSQYPTVGPAQRDMQTVLRKHGYRMLSMPGEDGSAAGISSVSDGRKCADFLRSHKGEFDGVILCLPNFGSEMGIAEAVKAVGVPILVQAYPDDLEVLGTGKKRAAFCGKLAIMNALRQHRVKVTVRGPHVVYPRDRAFGETLLFFDRVCRVCNGMRDLVVGCIGARTTPFRTVRVDERALQESGVTVETLDLSDLVRRARSVNTRDRRCKEKKEKIRGIVGWQNVPMEALDMMVRLGVALDEVIDEYGLNALALRCWPEMQRELGVSPCFLMGELSRRGVPAACEADVGSAISMKALGLASGEATACFDWYCNYGDCKDKCVLFHCGAAPASLMKGKGRIVEHTNLLSMLDKKDTYGCNVGRMSSFAFTFGGLITERGAVRAYVGQGRFTSDKIPAGFFGSAGVAHVENLEGVLDYIGGNGFYHHVNITPGAVVEPLVEAFRNYLGFEMALPQTMKLRTGQFRAESAD